MTSLTGLIEGNFTDIDVIDTIRINGDSGSNNQVLTSDGTFTSYQDPTAPPVADILTAGTGISITSSGNPETISTNVKSLILDGTAVSGAPITFNPNANGGDQTITINDTDTQLNLTAGAGINITTIGGSLNKLVSAKIDSDTLIFNAGDSITTEVAKVPNAITFADDGSGSRTGTFDGSSAITIDNSDTNTQLNLTADLPMEIDSSAGGLNRNVELNFDSNTLGAGGGALEVLKVPNALTAGSNISFNVGSTYDGSSAITITSSDTNTQLNLTEGNGISITNTGGLGRTIAMSADGTTLNNNVGSGQAGVIKVPNTLTAGTGITMADTSDGASATTYDGSSGITISSHLPIGIFNVSGDLRMTINLANFMPNDDSSFFNITTEDDSSTKIHGSIKPLSSSLEVCGYFIIPDGFTATACRIDLTNSSGSGISRDLTFESFTTYGGQTFSTLGNGVSGSEQTFTSNLAGASDKLLLIRINTTATTDHIRGGYIKLTAGGGSGG